MQHVNDTRLAYTIEAACEVTSLTRTRIYRAIADGSLKAFKAGRIARKLYATASSPLSGLIE